MSETKPIDCEPLKQLVRTVPDFPKPGILFYDITYPTPEALLALLNDSATALDTSLSALTPEALAAPAPPGPPSQDGKVSGFIGVLAWHETYHVGQIAYLRSWLGLSGVFG